MKAIKSEDRVVSTKIAAIALMAFGLPGLVPAQNAAAPATTPNKVGVIQIQAALGATKEGQKAAAELEAKMAPKKKELDGKQSEIRELQDRLQKGGNTLSDSAKDDLTRNIDAKTKSFNREVQDAQADLEEEQQKVLSGLGQKMMQVIDKYAAANGFAVILDVSNQNTPVLYASTAVDITKEIIDLYDKSTFTPTAAPNASPAKPGASAPPTASPAKPGLSSPAPVKTAPAPAPAKKQ